MILTLFSQSVLISQLRLYNFERKMENGVPNASLLSLPVTNCFAALFYIICASAVEHNFTAINSWCVKPCLLTLCSGSRKLPSEVPSDIG